MKKILALAAFTIVLYSCASDNDMKYDKKGDDEIRSENPVGIQNVNGNIPDTINTMDIGNYKTTDSISAFKDSAKK